MGRHPTDPEARRAPRRANAGKGRNEPKAAPRRVALDRRNWQVKAKADGGPEGNTAHPEGQKQEYVSLKPRGQEESGATYLVLRENTTTYSVPREMKTPSDE